MKVFGKTDRGMIRSSNQDCFDCGVFEDGAVWAVVCDGMGGANGGDIASRQAVEVIRGALLGGYKPKCSQRHIKKLFGEAASAANRALLTMTKEQPALAGMGTTLVAAVVRGDTAFVAHAGDSRAYIIDSESGSARQITKDHSVVQQLVDRGRISPEEARSHPHRNIITRAIGVGPDIETDFATHAVKASDRVLLCTDGLTGCVIDSDIAQLSGDTALEALPEKYIAAANENGGYDNITAVIIGE